jgi:hypothetical protein
MTGHLLAAGVGVAALAGWFLVYALALLSNRPAHPQPAPPTQDLGTEPPAIASLLANYWDITEDATESTLIDLAARHYLEFRQPANDPTQTTVHVREPDPSGLNAYERRVFDRVAGLAVGGVVPLTALTFRDRTQAATFAKRMRAEIIADARARGLSQRRFGPSVLAVLNATAVLAGLGVAGAVLLAGHAGTRALKGAGVAWLFSTVILAAIANSVGERDTPVGRAACARWLGVKAWLHNTEAFGDLPPAAVVVWDRYLSYGAALGATRVSSAVIDLGMGNRKRVWSSFGGTWHRVRVRYPRFWPRYGRRARATTVRGGLATAAGLLLLYYWAKGVAAAPGNPTVGQSVAARFAGSVRGLGLPLGAILLLYGLYVLVRVAIDLAAPLNITGQVLWCQVWKSRSSDKSRPAPWLHHLAIDDGTGERTTAWGLPSEYADQVSDGDTVTVKVRRWTRRVLELHVEQRGAAGRLAVSSTDENTEALIASTMGIPAVRDLAARMMRGPAVTPTALLTIDEVSRAVGAPVSPRGSNGGGAIPIAAAQFHTPDGRQAVLITVMSGLAAQLAMRARRAHQPLAGIGEEAYAGDGWALARRGDTVVTVTARHADPRNLHWLLFTAVGRLPVTAAS